MHSDPESPEPRFEKFMKMDDYPKDWNRRGVSQEDIDTKMVDSIEANDAMSIDEESQVREASRKRERSNSILNLTFSLQITKIRRLI